MTEAKTTRRKKDPKRARPMTALQRRRLRVPRIGLHEQAAERLRTMIVRGELAPGQLLGEADLSDALGVSRTPLREALKQLATEGLVELRLNHSAVVAPFRRAELTDLFETVSGIERCAAELAAARMEPSDVERLEALQEKIEWHHGRGELREYFQINQQIHSVIVGFARNAVLKATHDALLARAERARFFALSVLGRWEESVREHQEILAALKAGDAARAGQLLAHHVRRTGEIVAETLDGKADVVDAPEGSEKSRGRKTRKIAQ
ncbi:GntR family transcriptional regulator [Bradyrhizobium sp. ISRA443]|uniref:GntR family transcriptional regulator n=1 Tax=unclassified Bradyrhizobium TaxID=2631580 RepID=UPI00247B0323|nr:MULTISPECIES: GntR family transcriptional regulator [unclassified Bradyrhizobium]WGR91756.1 GntR family transcriptional regulator [Bradyrhizobium sp. ISRA435]WGS02102.1 GntR family transcriptional regulator [Bradyrhizobium sp. ISRA436]WGS08987.1 GntR family transcriptional regulator [Bradyrhizobium sp. ISRA437]WGS15876.1 GntR family transcriptional regulator [Bradyrhizobium sp. ISRA443]